MHPWKFPYNCGEVWAAGSFHAPWAWAGVQELFCTILTWAFINGGGWLGWGCSGGLVVVGAVPGDMDLLCTDPAGPQRPPVLVRPGWQPVPAISMFVIAVGGEPGGLQLTHEFL